MVRVPSARIDHFISEDIPYIDLTSLVIGIGDKEGQMEYFTRESGILAGVSIAEEIMKQLGCTVVSRQPDGTSLEKDETFMVVQGAASDLHAAWKVCLNMFDHLSAIATKTHKMVEAAHRGNPHCEVLTTRKSLPGIKDLMTEAVMIGGAFPHRLGLSETILIFDHHIAFMGGFDKFIEKIPEIKCRCIEKKLFVESNKEQASVLARAGVDGIQLDKMDPAELKDLVKEIRGIDSRITLIAAGGINPQNAEEYASTGVDGLATTAPFTAKPLDMSIRMHVL